MVMTLTERLRQFSRAVSEERWGEFSTRVPPDKDRDADFVLLRAAEEIESLRQRNSDLVTGLEACDEQVVALRQQLASQGEALAAALAACKGKDDELEQLRSPLNMYKLCGD
jgi:hypothetical protein